MKLLINFLFILCLISKSVYAEDVNIWLKNEIDFIINAYKNENISNVERFDYIEDTINKNFAGAGISKFVAGKAWVNADKQTKINYINLFKRHLALNIASMMQGYSDQTYSFANTKQDKKNNISMIDMVIQNNTNKLIITWRVKKSKDRFYVIDLLVADISLVVTKRSEFNSMLKDLDYDLKKFNALLENTNKNSYDKLVE